MRNALFTTLFSLSLAACIPVDGDDVGAVDSEAAAAALPDTRVLIDLPGDSSRSEREWSQYYVLTATVTGDVNDVIRGVLYWLDTITDYPVTSTEEDGTAIWGPWEDGPLDPNETRLWVAKADDGGHYWGLDKRAKDAAEDADWTTVVGGEIEEGSTEDAYAGYFGIDFDALSDLDPTTHATGKFISRFMVDGDSVNASAGYEDFNAGQDQDINALYHYEQVVGGEGFMDLGYLHDITGNGETETHVIRSRWTQDGEGRADALVTEGELGELVVTAAECWDTSFEAVYYTEDWSGVEEGDASLCAYEDVSFPEEID